MSITAEVFDKIQQSVKPSDRHVEIEGRPYTFGKFEPVEEPKPDLITLPSLDGFIEFCNSRHPDQWGGLVILVKDHTKVLLSSMNPFGYWLNYEIYAVTHSDIFVKPFRFGDRFDCEEFIIALQTGFVQTENQLKLIQIASNMSASSESKLEDDGMSQSTTVGRAIKSKVTIKNPVELKPYRSFHEIDQVESPFVFRIHDGGRGEPEVALYESDCGKWKLEAIKRIATYISERTAIKVIA